jgi:hypothetical protein
VLSLLKEVLVKIAKKLNKADITWALGGSVMLKLRGLPVKPNDIDLLVSLEDVEKADRVIQNLCQSRQNNSHKKDENYATQFFCQYKVDGIDLDLMAGFTLKLKEKGEKKIFKYRFNETSIVKNIKHNDAKIPLSSIEDWYVLYNLMPGKQNKVQLIEKYFKENGIQYPDILKGYQKENISTKLNHKINSVLNYTN